MNWISLEDSWPDEWEEVLAFNPHMSEHFGLALWYEHSSGEKVWQYRGVSGGPGLERSKRKPTYWAPLSPP